MVSLQSILAATDFSTDARHAAERAAMICAMTDASRGVLLHVLESSWLDTLKHFVSLSAETDQSLMANASRSLEELAAAIRERSGVVLEPQLRLGAVIDVILELSADFSLLVLGARGRHPLRDFAVGTTTQRLLRQTRKPILVVRREVTTPYQRVLVAVDFSSYSANALAYGQALSSQGNIHLAHVYQAPFEGKMQEAGVSKEIIREYRRKARLQAKSEMRHFIGSSGIDSSRLRQSIVYGDHVPSTLLKRVRDIDADLVVVGKQGKSLVERLLLGSVTLHLLTECPCDVLVTQ